ncbi:hypothetical protein B0H11DRAFT_1931444 [Mycena galericulata]|nr:hypothetical protein B0H11DRAFT_1931444 [Mycena galericulata]
MPQIKGKAKAKNLGRFAIKCKRSSSCDAAQPFKRSRASSPCHDDGHESSDSEPSDVETTPDLSSPPLDNYPDSDNEIESDIEVHEEDDIPHPNSAADLAHWLKLSDAQLSSLHTSAAPAHRGAYHSTKIGKELSVRRVQEIRKKENKNPKIN